MRTGNFGSMHINMILRFTIYQKFCSIIVIKEESMYTHAATKHTYLFGKIVMNHPELYTKHQVEQAIQTIKEMEGLADYYFSSTEELKIEYEQLVLELGNYLNNNVLQEKQIIDLSGKKVGLCALETLKNKSYIKKLYKKMDVDIILFYAPLRYESPLLHNCKFAWRRDKGIINSNGNIFPFVFGKKRENNDNQLIAYHHLERYNEKKQMDLNHIIERQQKTISNREKTIKGKEYLIKKQQQTINNREKTIKGQKYLIKKLEAQYEKNIQNTKDLTTLLNSIQKVTHYSITKNPIQKYKAYKIMLKTYWRIQRFKNDKQ